LADRMLKYLKEFIVLGGSDGEKADRVYIFVDCLHVSRM
jgi:hypothetical protein